MTRSELKTHLLDLATSLSLMADRDAKDHAVADILQMLGDVLSFRTEREFAEHCRRFDSHEALARLDEESRARRKTGPLGPPPEGSW